MGDFTSARLWQIKAGEQIEQQTEHGEDDEDPETQQGVHGGEEESHQKVAAPAHLVAQRERRGARGHFKEFCKQREIWITASIEGEEFTLTCANEGGHGTQGQLEGH